MAFAGKRHAQELKKLEKTDVKISEARLFNPYATTQNVIDDIDELLPRLSPHHPEIAELLQTAKAEPVTPFTIHGHCDDSETKTWPRTDPAMDRWFPDAVEQAPYIKHPPLWLDQRAANHVKPCQVACRIVLYINHPECFKRYRAHVTTKAQHRQALRERLVDLTMVYFGRPVSLPAFLSTTQTWHQHSTGQLVPLRVFADFLDGDGDETELRTALTWPRTPSGFECLRDWLQGRSSTVAEISKIALIYKVHTVAGKYCRKFFQSAEMVAQYGPRAATFEKAMERMWDKTALIEEDDDDEEEGPPRKRTKVTGVKAGLSKEGYDRQIYKVFQTKLATDDDMAKERLEKKRQTSRDWHAAQKAKVDAMDEKKPSNDAVDKNKKSTTKKAPSKSLESGRRSRALRDLKIAQGDPTAMRARESRGSSRPSGLRPRRSRSRRLTCSRLRIRRKRKTSRTRRTLNTHVQ
ncbi:hypothetical protein J4E93_003738 [Alternaria ventricosa]|uniref:uncharacterized protein n=1 Tax=Alternaria ventricosa TaxID=1187951 RepID=UPI0020C34842|nr:uncharacterized protein J4E93_003738 [Alternaria ventricosa]KAI4649420.1 hypothetical protein J4E93_003738 [Alternaria ventricosa]